MAERATPAVHRAAWAAPALSRRVSAALLSLAAAGLLAGCSSAPASRQSGDASRTQQGASGVTVFGDIDVGVTHQRTR